MPRPPESSPAPSRWAAATPGAEPTMERPDVFWGRADGKPWENHGKTMGKPWENGKIEV